MNKEDTETGVSYREELVSSNLLVFHLLVAPLSQVFSNLSTSRVTIFTVESGGSGEREGGRGGGGGGQS